MKQYILPGLTISLIFICPLIAAIHFNNPWLLLVWLYASGFKYSEK